MKLLKLTLLVGLIGILTACGRSESPGFDPGPADDARRQLEEVGCEFEKSEPKVSYRSYQDRYSTIRYAISCPPPQTEAELDRLLALITAYRDVTSSCPETSDHKKYRQVVEKFIQETQFESLREQLRQREQLAAKLQAAASESEIVVSRLNSYAVRFASFQEEFGLEFTSEDGNLPPTNAYLDEKRLKEGVIREEAVSKIHLFASEFEKEVWPPVEQMLSFFLQRGKDMFESEGSPENQEGLRSDYKEFRQETESPDSIFKEVIERVEYTEREAFRSALFYGLVLSDSEYEAPLAVLKDIVPLLKGDLKPPVVRPPAPAADPGAIVATEITSEVTGTKDLSSLIGH